MEFSDKDKKGSLIAIIGTITFHAVVLFLCLFFGLSVPLPLPEEQGVEVNLGNSETGFGVTTAAPRGQDNLASRTSSSANTTDENYSTQNLEETNAINSNRNNSRTNRRENPQTPTSDQPQEPQVNENALFPSQRTGSENGGGQGTGQGITTGSGDQGKAGGDPNSNVYDGTPGKGGISFSLRGRSAKSLPKPQYTSKEQGNVVVKIWVNREGVVTRAEAGERGTTIADRSLWRMSEEAARQSKFSPDENAAEIQTGTITYKFIRSN